MKANNGPINLRSATKKDVNQLISWWADGRVMAHAGFPNGINTDKDKLTKDIQKQNNQVQPESERLVIEYNEKLIGEMSYRKLENNVYEIGIKICDFDYQNKGLGKYCMKALMNYLFQVRLATKIILDTNQLNKRAQYFYKKLGFKQVGIRENAFTNQLGVPQTAIDFELSQENFQ